MVTCLHSVFNFGLNRKGSLMGLSAPCLVDYSVVDVTCSPCSHHGSTRILCSWHILTTRYEWRAMNRDHLRCSRKTPLFHQTSFTKPKFKDNIIKNFTVAIAETSTMLMALLSTQPLSALWLQIHEAGPAPLPLLGSLQSLVPSC